MSKTIEWVYGLKFLGILAVILGHIASPFSNIIFSWHMPLFFMIAGFFIKTEDTLKVLVIKDWKRLMIPYFIFAFLALVMTSIKAWGLQRGELNYLDELIAIVFWMDYKHLINTYAFVLWFLPALFFSKIYYYIIKKKCTSAPLQAVVFVALFIVSFQLKLPFGLSNAMNSVLWLFIGSLLFDFLKRERQFVFYGFSLSLTVILPTVIIIVIYLYFGVPKLDMSSLIYGNKFVNVLWAVSMFLLLATFFKNIYGSLNVAGNIKLWANGTMLLFIAHPYFNNISHLIVVKLQYGGWPLKLLISLFSLQLLLMIKERFTDRWIFKYV